MARSEIVGVLLDDDLELAMEEICEACSMSSSWVIELVDEGILKPSGSAATGWRFSGVALARAQIARRLQRDLEVNMAGVALALELMDEIHSLRQRVSRMAEEERNFPRGRYG